MGLPATYIGNESISQLMKVLTDTIARSLVVHTLIGTLSTTDQKRIFVCPPSPTSKVYIRAVYFITETGDAVDASDYWEFQVVNVTQSDDELGSEVTGNEYGVGSAIVADTPYELLIDQNNVLVAGDVLELSAVGEGSATSQAECSVIVVYSYDDSDDLT